MASCREIMVADVMTVHPDMTLREAVEALRAAGVTGAPVVEGDEVVGVVSATDVLEFEATSSGVPTERKELLGVEDYGAAGTWEEGDEQPSAYFMEMWTDAGADVFERFSETRGPEWDRLEEHFVGEVMSRGIRSVTPDTELREAARYMHEASVHRVLVLEDGELAGILTATDIVRAVAENVI